MLKVKNSLNPVNWIEQIKEMPLTSKMYYSKVLVAFIVGIVFGTTNFRNWPAVLTMIVVYLIVSGIWALIYNNKNTGLKTRSFFTSAVFQFFIIVIAMWTLILNLMYVEPSNWQFNY